PLHEALDELGRDALLLLFASAHYRQPLNWADDSIEQARAGVRRLREIGRRLTRGLDAHQDAATDDAELSGRGEAFAAALADDFNTAAALGQVWTWVRRANVVLDDGATVGDGQLRAMLDVLGLANLLDADPSDGPDAAALDLL